VRGWESEEKEEFSRHLLGVEKYLKKQKRNARRENAKSKQNWK